MLASILLLIIQYSYPSSGDSLNLCDNPIISAADRMSNGTVRLYRGGYYWELYGMPDRVGLLSDAKKILIPYLGPVLPTASLMTCLECNRKGYLFKFEQGKVWSWVPNGVPWKTNAKGRDFLKNQDFDTVFHNGRSDEPLMIGIKGKQVFYYSTKEYEIEESPEHGLKGYEGGKNKENFPTGVNASFSWTPRISDEGYYVFFFRGDKYCRRKEVLASGQECDEWRENRELFGCKVRNY